MKPGPGAAFVFEKDKKRKEHRYDEPALHLSLKKIKKEKNIGMMKPGPGAAFIFEKDKKRKEHW